MYRHTYILYINTLRFPDDPENEFKCQAVMVLRKIGLEELVPHINGALAQRLNSESSQHESSLSGRSMSTVDPTDKLDSRFYESLATDVTSSSLVTKTVVSKPPETFLGCSSDLIQAEPEQVWPTYDSDSTKPFVHQKSDKNDETVATHNKSDVHMSARSCLLSKNQMGDGSRSFNSRISGFLPTKDKAHFFVTEELTDEDLEFDFPSEIFPSDLNHSDSFTSKEKMNENTCKAALATEPSKKKRRS